MTTSPGFPSRVTAATLRQLPLRDEALMNEHDTPGFSNSEPIDDEATEPTDKPIGEKVVTTEQVEDKAVRAPQTKRRKPAKG